MSEPTTVDWSRLALLIDGEGCLEISKVRLKNPNHTTRYFIRCSIYNTDPRVIIWVRDTFGVGRVSGRRRSQKPCYDWTLSCSSLVPILEGCLPYFVIKKEQAQDLLEFQKRLGYLVGGRDAARKRIPTEELREREYLYDAFHFWHKEMNGYICTQDELNAGQVGQGQLRYLREWLSRPA